MFVLFKGQIEQNVINLAAMADPFRPEGATLCQSFATMYSLRMLPTDD